MCWLYLRGLFGSWVGVALVLRCELGLALMDFVPLGFGASFGFVALLPGTVLDLDSAGCA
eukprot:2501847-Amphidinium_carterae.1